MVKRRSAISPVKLFLDSSVLFTAVNSPTGGSAKLFILPKTLLFSSKVVLHEVEKNVRKKLAGYHLNRFFILALKLNILDSNLDSFSILQSEKVIAKKDAVILAEFKKSKCDALITLDKKDFLQNEVYRFIHPKKIFTPKSFFDSLAN